MNEYDKNLYQESIHQNSQLSGASPKEEGVFYVKGIIGAAAGAAIGSLPALIIGLMGLVSLWLCILIAFGAFKGYQIMKGPRKEKFAFYTVLICSEIPPVIADMILLWKHGDSMDANPAFTIWIAGTIAFSAIGSFVCRRKIITYVHPELLQEVPWKAADSNNRQENLQNNKIYFAQKGWLLPYKVSIISAAFPGIIIAIFLLYLSSSGIYRTETLIASLGCILGEFIVLGFYIHAMMLVQTEVWTYIRYEDGELWRVQLNKLNSMDAYRFTYKDRTICAVTWSGLQPVEQELGRASVFRAIEDLKSGRVLSGSVLSQIVVPLKEMKCIKETKWAWTMGYKTSYNSQKTIKIAKTYKDFTPLIGMKPVNGPVPYAWEYIAAALAVVLGFTVLAVEIGILLFSGNVNKPDQNEYRQYMESKENLKQSIGQDNDFYLDESKEGEEVDCSTNMLEGGYYRKQMKLTERNYKTFFLSAAGEGYQYLGIAYYRAPEEMYGETRFLNAYLPYGGGSLRHSDDGEAVEASKHGMRVCQTIKYSDMDAQEVVENKYKGLLEEGLDINEEGTYQTQYIKESDLAYKQISYYEENHTIPRAAVLYADLQEKNYYLYAEITYLPEQMDGDYPALLQELNTVFGLELPEIPAL